MVDPEDFARARQLGVKAGNRFLAVTIAVPDEGAAISRAEVPARAGLIVPKSQIPLAVDRNRVKRQLRHLLMSRIGQYPKGTLLIVRVFRAIKGRDSAFMAAKLDSALSEAAKKLGSGGGA